MVKRIFDELKWHPEKSLEGVEIVYLHRGAPDDRITVKATEVERFERGYFVLLRRGREVYIPYHRILEVKKGDKILYRKKSQISY